MDQLVAGVRVPATIPLAVVCTGCQRRPPFRTTKLSQQFFRRLHIPPDLPVETYRCINCKRIVVVTAQDLGWV